MLRLLSALPHGFLSRLSWQYAASATTILAGFAYSVILARALGVRDFGIFALVLAIATFAGQLLNVTTKEMLIRFLPLHAAASESSSARGLIRAAFLLNLVCAGLVLVALTAGHRLVGAYFFDGHNIAACLVVAGFIVAGQTILVESSTGVLRAQGQVRWMAMAQVALQLGRLGLTLAALAIGMRSPLAMLWVSAACVLLFALTHNLRLAGVVRRHYPGSTRTHASALGALSAHTSFLRHTYATALLSIPSKDLDVNLLGFFAGVESVAVYRVAKNFVAALWALTDPLFLVIYPELAQMFAVNAITRLRGFLSRITAVLAAGAAIVMVSCLFAVPFLIDQLIGRSFGGATTLFYVMMSTMIVWAPLSWLQSFFLAAGRPDIGTKSAAAHAALSLIVYVVAIRTSGPTGAAVGYAINAAAIAIIQLLVGYRSRAFAILWGDDMQHWRG
jgi:O-antigen/teichoic acid export membrane protein